MRNRTLLLALGASLVLPASLSAQANASSDLLTYGDIGGGAGQARLWNATPNVPAFILPSLLNTTSNYLVGQTGDPNDLLSVGIDLAAQGTYFQGTTNAQGEFIAAYVIPGTAPLDLPVYWQGLTRPGGGAAAEYDDFSFKRIMTTNAANRWQQDLNNLPVAPANLAWVVTKTGPNGDPTEIFACGGGPALLTDVGVPYITFTEAWYYDVADAEYRVVASMNQDRAFHTCTLLADGRILVTGGVAFGGQKPSGDYYTKVLNDTEIYDPATDTWTVGPAMNDYRAGQTANLLDNGQVLITGGTEGNGLHELTDFVDLLSTEVRTIDLYDPVANTIAAGPNLREPKAGHAGIKLLDGKIALLGGITFSVILGIPIPDFSSLVDIYDPVANTISSGGNMGSPRALFGSALLPSGKIACAGGAGGPVTNPGAIKQVHVYDPATKSATAMNTMPTEASFLVARADPANPDGVYLVGGADGNVDDPTPKDTLYYLDTASGTVSTLTPMPVKRGGGVVEVLEDGTIYAAGGESNSGSAIDRVDSYTP